MVNCSLHYLVLGFVHRPVFLKTRFGNWTFPSSGMGQEAPILFGPLERADLNHSPVRKT